MLETIGLIVFYVAPIIFILAMVYGTYRVLTYKPKFDALADYWKNMEGKDPW